MPYTEDEARELFEVMVGRDNWKKERPPVTGVKLIKSTDEYPCVTFRLDDGGSIGCRFCGTESFYGYDKKHFYCTECNIHHAGIPWATLFNAIGDFVRWLARQARPVPDPQLLKLLEIPEEGMPEANSEAPVYILETTNPGDVFEIKGWMIVTDSVHYFRHEEDVNIIIASFPNILIRHVILKDTRLVNRPINIGQNLFEGESIDEKQIHNTK